MTLKSKLRGKASAINIVLGVACLTLFCTIIAQCSLTIKVHQCGGPGMPGIGEVELCMLGANTNQANAINGLAIFNLIMVLLLPSVQVVLKNV